MRVFSALNFSEPIGPEIGLAWCAPVEALALFPVRDQILPELAQAFLTVLLMQFQKVGPVGLCQGGTFGAVPEIPELSFFQPDLFAQEFSGIGGLLLQLPPGVPLSTAHCSASQAWGTSKPPE
jgi:hypothetical protein